MGQETLQKILELFKKEQVVFTLETHAQIPRSSHEAAKIRGSDVTKGAKALILQADEKFIQVVIPAHKRTKFSALKKLFGFKRVQLASPDAVFEKTSCVVGSVPPLGVLWNLSVYVDEGLLTNEEIVFSAGTLTESIHVSAKELVRVNNASIVSISED